MYQDPIVQSEIQRRIYDILYSQRNFPSQTQFANGAAILGGYVHPDELAKMVEDQAYGCARRKKMIKGGNKLMDMMISYTPSEEDAKILDDIIAQSEAKGAGFLGIIKTLAKIIGPNIKPAAKAIATFIEEREKGKKASKAEKGKKDAAKKLKEKEAELKKREAELAKKIKDMNKGAAIVGGAIVGGADNLVVAVPTPLVDIDTVVDGGAKKVRKKREYKGNNPWVEFCKACRKEERDKGMKHRSNKELASLYKEQKSKK